MNAYQLSFDDLPVRPDGLPPLACDRSLADAQERVRQGRWTREGVHCETCGQYCKVYPRRVHKAMAVALIRLYRAGGTTAQYKPTVVAGLGSAARDECVLKHYGLLVQAAPPPEAKGRKDSWWRVTEKGADFIERRIRVPKYALLFNDICLDFSSESISIDEALGNPFDLAELLGYEPGPR
jgi:hypothetical protein